MQKKSEIVDRAIELKEWRGKILEEIENEDYKNINMLASLNFAIEEYSNILEEPISYKSPPLYKQPEMLIEEPEEIMPEELYLPPITPESED